jgi:acyl-CoA thioester hydrolase
VARFNAKVAMRWSDMDAYGHVNNVQFLTYVEEARVDMFKLVPWGTDQLEAGIVVAQSEIKYMHPLLHRHAPVPIDVWVTHIGAASFRLQYEVHENGAEDFDPAGSDDSRDAKAEMKPGLVYATASSVMVPYDFAAERPRRLTADEKAWLGTYLEPAASDAKRVERGDRDPATA